MVSPKDAGIAVASLFAFALMIHANGKRRNRRAGEDFQPAVDRFKKNRTAISV